MDQSNALPAAVANPNYGLFGCQVTGLNSSATCYDPYQMRHAYNVDTLINAGLDGRGKTIVIVDAYQSPNIVQQLKYFNSFYGLASLNGLGGAHDPSLGTFTQVAPDGLTPFVTGDPNMSGWAEEISLDVLWSHAIAPGANIVLVLAKSNNNDDILSATKYAVDHRLGDVISQSFGENESCVRSQACSEKQHEVFADATRKNITLFASSGDLGAAQVSCDGSSLVKAVSNPASDPLVTAVGGTELHAASYCLTGRRLRSDGKPGTRNLSGRDCMERVAGLWCQRRRLQCGVRQAVVPMGGDPWRRRSGSAGRFLQRRGAAWCIDLPQYSGHPGRLLSLWRH